MHSEERKRLYREERNYLNHLKNGVVDTAALNSTMSAATEICQDFRDKAMHSVNRLLNLTTKINFTSDFLKLLQGIQTSSLTNTISENEFLVAKKFVEELLNINLNNIEWKYLSKPLREQAEGFCISCEDDKHFIFIQDDQFGIISTDLLVHEIGHAADFTISRSLQNDALLVRHQSLAECIAFYCQYKFLKHFGDRNKRIGAFGGFLLTYLAITILKYCIELNISLSDLDPEIAIQDEKFNNIIYSYDFDAKDFIKAKIQELQTIHSDLASMIFNEISPRFGAVLAIYLLDKDDEFIKSLIATNSIENDLSEIVERIIPNYDINITQLQERLSCFFANQTFNH